MPDSFNNPVLIAAVNYEQGKYCQNKLNLGKDECFICTPDIAPTGIHPEEVLIYGDVVKWYMFIQNLRLVMNPNTIIRKYDRL